MYIIFDMDGVILDSEKVYLDGYLYAADRYGLDQDRMREAYQAAVGVTDLVEKQIMEEWFGEDMSGSVEELYHLDRQYYHRIVDEGRMELKTGVRETISWLKEHGYKIGLASSSGMEMIQKELGGLGLISSFDVIVSGDMVDKSKPDPEIFIQCADKLGMTEEDYPETCVVEDSYNGIRAAERAGMVPVMIPDRLPPTKEMREKSAVILPSLNELPDYLSGHFTE